jgi:hypothetical protein
MAELAALPLCRVEAFVADEDDGSALLKILIELGYESDTGGIAITVMNLPRWYRFATAKSSVLRQSKLAKLLLWRKRLKRGDALIAAERTSTIIARMPGKCPPMIHIPHGAGDRSKGFERRIALFDYVIVGGAKDRERMIGLGLVAADHCFVSGYVKLSGVLKINAHIKQPRLPMFDGERPVILYNPHFDPRLSSWHLYGKNIAEKIAQDGRFNLIIAPHVRLFEHASPNVIQEVTALAIPGRIFVDPGSERSMDMSYTTAADIYLGDVSSQVYEFLFRPRPCVFVNSHKAEWAGNPDYLMWTAGEVIDSVDALLPALAAAQDRHQHYNRVQQKLVKDAFGDAPVNAAANAAAIILRLIARPANAA